MAHVCLVLMRMRVRAWRPQNFCLCTDPGLEHGKKMLGIVDGCLPVNLNRKPLTSVFLPLPAAEVTTKALGFGHVQLGTQN